MARRHDRADIERALARREVQGLTFVELGRQTGIPSGTLAYWSHKLRRQARELEGGGFVQLIGTGRSSSSDEVVDARPPASVRIEHPSGTVIEFFGDAAQAVTDHLVEALPSWL